MTAQEFLGSCIFLFVKHPYDVGDRVDIVGPGGTEYLVVEQISLLYSVFKRIDNMKLVQVPNIILNSLWIENITRSNAMKEQLDMFISFDTTLEDIETLRTEMESFVQHPDNSRDFFPDIVLEATGIGNMDKLQLKIEIRHKSNWHNETVRASRRSKFMCALVLALRKVPIYGPGGGGEPLGGPTNPGYSVSVSDSWAADSREKATKAKEAQRLVPTAPASAPGPDSKLAGALGSLPEEAAATSLNNRRPTLDAAYENLTRSDSAHSRGGDDTSMRNPSIDASRNDIVSRKSTRGRRKPGETAPSTQEDVPPGVPGPAFNLTSPTPRASSPQTKSLSPFESRRSDRDEEAGLGGYEMDGPVRDEREYGSHPMQQQQQPHQGGAPTAYNTRYQQGADGEQLLPTSPQTRLQRLSLGFGSGEGDEPFI